MHIGRSMLRRCLGQRNRKRNGLGNRLYYYRALRHVEGLEERVLLAADPFYSAELSATGVDLTLRVDNEVGEQRLKLIDSVDGSEVTSALLSEITNGARIVGSTFADTLRIEVDPSFMTGNISGELIFDGNTGIDTLIGPSTDTTWTITGDQSGNVGGAGGLEFSEVENLTGAADNEDTFVFPCRGQHSRFDQRRSKG